MMIMWVMMMVTVMIFVAIRHIEKISLGARLCG